MQFIKCPEMVEYVAAPRLTAIVLDNSVIGMGWPTIKTLLSLMYSRFNHSAGKGFLIVWENIKCSPSQLEALLIEVAHSEKLEFEFIDWIENCNFFHNKRPRNMVLETCFET